jgi:hypothetical protein
LTVIRDVSCEFVDQIFVVAKATIHEFTRNVRKVTLNSQLAGFEAKVGLTVFSA